MKEIRETKWVEQTTVRFVANDGKVFFNKQDCAIYERRLDADLIEKSYKKILIGSLDYPFMGWSGEFNIDFVKLNSAADFYSMVDYLQVNYSNIDVDFVEPEKYPCVRAVAYDECYANFGFENNIETMLSMSKKAVEIIQNAIEAQK